MRLKRLSTILRLLAVVAAAALLLGLFPQDPLRRWTESRLRAALGGQVRLGALHVVPGALRADVADLLLETPLYRFEVPRARIDVSAATLWSGS